MRVPRMINFSWMILNFWFHLRLLEVIKEYRSRLSITQIIS
jgi:hypothetical protein